MIFSASSNYKFFVQDYSVQQDRLHNAMQKISSGQRFIAPGEAPADLGISERFRAQISNTEAASRVIQNATNLFQTADAFMQNSNDILTRMSELAISAYDSSKNDGDRLNLDLEFQQLKSELSRISELGKYNGMQINGKTAVSVWDDVSDKVVYYQPDGTQKRTLELTLGAADTSQNGYTYGFQNAAGTEIGDFQFSQDGKSLMYFAHEALGNGSTTYGMNTLVKLELSSDTITYLNMDANNITTNANGPNGFQLKNDNQGRLWATYADGGTATDMKIGLIDENQLAIDLGATSTSDWAGMGTQKLSANFTDFSVSGDYFYYFDEDDNFSKQSLFDTSDKKVLMSVASLQTDPAAGLRQVAGAQTVVSSDGRYIAYENTTSGSLVVVDTVSAEFSSIVVGETTAGTVAGNVVGLGFDDNNNLYWTNTGSTAKKNTLNKISVKRADDGSPDLSDWQVLVNTNNERLGAAAIATNAGLNVSGGSPAANFEFQVGPDASQTVEFVSANVSLFGLGIMGTDIRSMDSAEKAVERIAGAIDKVANQRAVMGSQVSRLTYTLASNETYNSNISAAESRLRDVDLASESAKMTTAQILSQSALQILQFSNNERANIMALLQF